MNPNKQTKKLNCVERRKSTQMRRCDDTKRTVLNTGEWAWPDHPNQQHYSHFGRNNIEFTTIYRARNKASGFNLLEFKSSWLHCRKTAAPAVETSCVWELHKHHNRVKRGWPSERWVKQHREIVAPILKRSCTTGESFWINCTWRCYPSIYLSIYPSNQ